VDILSTDILSTDIPFANILSTSRIKILKEEKVNIIKDLVTDLILAVVELLGRDISRLVVEVREVLEPVEPWDEG
jgi:hypothetical protein